MKKTEFKKLLLIDDSPEIHTLLNFWLKNESIEILHASDGAEGLQIAFAVVPDIILLDVGLPVQDGFEICKIIKSKSETQLIPVIFLTGSDDTHDKIYGLNIGAADYITKPFDPGELVARIRAILRARELEQFNAELEHSVEKQTQELIKTNFKLQEEIQERKQIEEEIRKHKGHLEFLVEEKTKDLAIALDQAVAGSEAKNIFLAQMSHELRTPLNAIIGYSEILLEEVIDDGHDDYIPIVSPITNAGHNLLKIIDSILDIAHVESGKLEAVIQNIDVDELVQEVVDEIIPIISKNKNNLKINISEEVGVIRQDSEKLSKMLENLLDNAAKYTDSGDIVLTVESKMEEGSRYITFKVQDTGIGIEADKIEIIFEPFMQADNSYTRNYDGAGLGLSLVKKYVDLMKGVINVKSEVGVGSSFSICVPVFD